MKSEERCYCNKDETPCGCKTCKGEAKPFDFTETVKRTGLSESNIVRFTYDRIPDEERDPKLHYYSIRHEDECGMTPCQIGKGIWANHWGDMATKEPLTGIDKDCGVILLTDEESDYVYGLNPKGNKWNKELNR